MVHHSLDIERYISSLSKHAAAPLAMAMLNGEEIPE